MIRLAPQPGIAIGPILMAIALIGVLVAAISMGSNSLGGAAIQQDRTVAELRGQIDLIRSKIDECVMLTRQVAVPQFLYPGDGALLHTPILVKDLDCPRDPTGRQNLWRGARPTAFPPATKGFMEWTYVNHGDPLYMAPNGICIKIKPVDDAHANDEILRSSLRLVMKNYSSAEYTFDDATQTLIIWILRSTALSTC